MTEFFPKATCIRAYARDLPSRFRIYNYPKTFMWRGWHPRCMCSISPILMDRKSDEWKKLRAMSDEDYKKYQSPNLVKNVPDKFKTWCDTNKDKLNAAREKGKLPYFVRDNEKVVGKLVGWEEPKQGKQGKQGYLGRSAKNEAYEVYKNEKPTVISKEQEKNVLEIAKMMGIKMTKVKPMTFNEADNGQANVNYRKGEEYRTNCQTCVVVHEARLRGLDITARGYIDKVGSISYELGEHFENAWINPKNGKTPHPTIIKYDKDWLQKALKQMKADGRYHVGLNYNDNTGHVIVAESIKGKVIFYDPQSNDFVDINVRKISSIEILKIDKLNINKNIIIQISESI